MLRLEVILDTECLSNQIRQCGDMCKYFSLFCLFCIGMDFISDCVVSLQPNASKVVFFSWFFES